MKILVLLIVLCALCPETRHQFPIFYPPFSSISLANEEFIEPPGIVDGVQFEEKVALKPLTSGGESESVNGPGVPISLEAEHAQLSPTATPVETDPAGAIEAAVEGKRELVDAKEPVVAVGAATATNISEAGAGNGNASSGGGAEEAPKKGEVEEPIPSYMEWAQKKQKEMTNLASQNGHAPSSGNGHHSAPGQNGQHHPGTGTKNGSSPTQHVSRIDGKNFASPDCGAKVVQSNAEAQNPAGVLSSSHDEYMLNTCGNNIWFVVELCEPLNIEAISIGNLELFSSSPKEVEFGISDRYPTRDWVRLGPITLPDSRAIHPIILPSSNSSMFGKFVKVTVLSRYGTEHFCPISLIKVNGKSEYEVLESETIREDEQDAVFEEPLEFETTTEGRGKVAGMKDTFWNMLNKAVQAIVRGGSPSDPQLSGDDSYHALLSSKCRSILQCVPPQSQDIDEEIYKLLSCNATDLLPFLARHSPWCGWDYCHSLFESRSIGLPWQPEGFYASLFGGPPVLHALCHYIKPLTEGCDPTCFGINRTHHPHHPHPSNHSIDYTNESIAGGNLTGDAPFKTTEQDIQLSASIQVELEPGVAYTSPAPTPTTTTAPNIPAEDQQLDPQAPPDPSSITSSTLATPAQETQIVSPVPNPTEEAAAPAVFVAPTPSSPPPPSGGFQQKESVFVRLTNRIKTLEMNQSLTASYLDELSKRFKKQNEESAAVVEMNKRNLEETRRQLFQLDGFYRGEMGSLRRNLEDVRERLFNVQLQRSLLLLICLAQMGLLFAVVGWVRRKISRLEASARASAPAADADASSTSPSEDGEVLFPQERRRESDPLVQSQPFSSTSSPDRSRKRSNSFSTVTSESKSKRMRKKNKKSIGNRGSGGDVSGALRNGAVPVPSLESSKILRLEDAPPATFDGLPKSRSGEGFFTVPNHTVKEFSSMSAATSKSEENVDPLSNSNAANVAPFSTKSRAAAISQLPPRTLILPSNHSHSSSKSDSDFSISSLHQSSSPFLDSGISTSSRFALLASPNRESPQAEKRIRFLSSIPPYPTQYHSTNATANANGKSASMESTSQTSSSSSTGGGKKPKKGVGLKALMPKLFDR